jgi:hypothetical protein
MFCPACGKTIPDDSKFCLHCGTPMPIFSSTQEDLKQYSQKTHDTDCPSCGQKDLVQKVESVVNEGVVKGSVAGYSVKSISELARYFFLPEMPAGNTINSKMMLVDNKQRVLWRIMRYKRSLLYYCHRDFIVFIPGQDIIINPSETQSYYVDNIEGKYCVIQSIVESCLLTADRYFVARVPAKNKQIVDIVKVKSDEFYPIRIKEDDKSHSALVNQLKHDGWVVIEKELKPAPWFEWVLTNI